MRTHYFLLILATVAFSCSGKKPAPELVDSSPADVSADTVEAPEEVNSLVFPFPVPEVPYAEPVWALHSDTVVVTKTAILFATVGVHGLGSPDLDRGSFETLVELEDGRVPGSAKKGGAASFYVTAVARRLEKAATPSSGERRITVLVDPETDYRLLTELLYSSGQAKVGGFDFVVTSQGVPGVVRIDAPEIPDCETAVPACTRVTAVVKEGTSLFLFDEVQGCSEEAESGTPVRVDAGQCIHPALEPGLIGQVATYPESLCSWAVVLAGPDSGASEVLATAAALSLAPFTASTVFSVAADEVSHNCDWQSWTPDAVGSSTSGDFRYEDHARKQAESICDWYDSCADEEQVFSMTAALQRLSTLSSLAWREVFDDAVRRGGGKLSHAACMTFLYETRAVAVRQMQAKIEAGFVKFSPRNGIACIEAGRETLPACEARKLAFDPMKGLTDPALRGRREELSLRMQARFEHIGSPAVCDTVLQGTVPEGGACDLTAECLGQTKCVDGTCESPGE